MPNMITTQDNIPYLMSAKHLQQMGLARTMVYNLLNTEGFPVIQIGKRKVVPKDKFFEWINHNMNNQNASM